MGNFDFSVKKPEKPVFSSKKVKYTGKIAENLQKIPNNLHEIKLACLSKKSVLYRDNSLEIRENHDIFKKNGKNYLKILVFFTNKTDEDFFKNSIDFYSENGKKFEKIRFFLNQQKGLTLWIKPKKMPEILVAKTSFLLEIVLNYTEIPFSLLFLDFSYEYRSFPLIFSLKKP